MNNGTGSPTYPPLRKRGLLIIDAILLSVCLLAPHMAELLLALPTDCYVQRLGYLCPACGGTRSVLLLFRGDMVGAFRMNPYFFLTAVLACVTLVVLHISVFTPKHLFAGICRRILRPRTAVAWAIGFVLFGILRNIIHM